jgi:hypothetical protein
VKDGYTVSIRGPVPSDLAARIEAAHAAAVLAAPPPQKQADEKGGAPQKGAPQ